MPFDNLAGGWNCIANLISLASSVFGCELALNDEKLKPIKDDVVRAWTHAGAWYEPMEKKGELPAFGFPHWQPGVLGRLPDPSVPFVLSLDCSPVTDEGMKELAGLKCMQELSLRFTKVTGEGFKELSKLNLQCVDMTHTKVSERGLMALGALSSLERLSLAEAELPKANLKVLAKSKRLESLNLERSSVTDEQLKGLADLATLQSLNVASTNVTGEGLQHLPSNLQSLNVSIFGGRKDMKPISSEIRLEGLAGLLNLRDLRLDGRAVTNADLKRLVVLKKLLEKLDLSRTKVTEEGVADLKRELPKCEIQFSGSAMR